MHLSTMSSQVIVKNTKKRPSRGNRYQRAMGVSRLYRRYIPRSLTGRGNSCIIPLSTFYNFNLTADVSAAFRWDTAYLYVDATAFAVPGASELHNVWELMRIQKVEIIIRPSATDLAYNDQTVTTGQTNIPFVYYATDYQDPNNGKSLAAIQQNPQVRYSQLNKIIRHTVYPRITADGPIIDVGMNYKNLFMRAGTSNTNSWSGFVMHVDLTSQVWTYGTFRIDFKIFYECMNSK